MAKYEFTGRSLIIDYQSLKRLTGPLSSAKAEKRMADSMTRTVFEGKLM